MNLVPGAGDKIGNSFVAGSRLARRLDISEQGFGMGGCGCSGGGGKCHIGKSAMVLKISMT